jgi:CheY-like chemotaxis protein/two-component sensor histidine kinase
MAFERSSSFAEAKEREERLRVADRRKDEFLAMLAHELRNPLASIKLGVQMLRAGGMDQDRIDRYHAMLERQTSNLSRLVDDLLEVSRITRGAIELHREVVDHRTVVKRAAESVFPPERPRARNLTMAIDEGPVWVEGDAVRLEQVVTNVLSNAVRYTDVGGSIHVCLSRAGEKARLVVRDSGVGIPADMLEHVFDLFAQADESLARTRGGLGIGLTIVRRLLDLHGGTVRARSGGVGKGTEIEIELPLCAAEAPPPSQPAPALGARMLRVLVVDDNADARQMLADAVSDCGHDVSVAADGASAIEVATRVRPELILLDIGLPDIDGYEVARRLRATHTTAALVAVTGYGQTRDRERAREAGFDAHLVKPLDLDALTALLVDRARERPNAPA